MPPQNKKLYQVTKPTMAPKGTPLKVDVATILKKA